MSVDLGTRPAVAADDSARDPRDVDLDVLGVGFGPANVALAIALEEHRQAARLTGDDLRVLFVEQSPTLSWHEGMLLDDASMQVSFLKDLATFRNPTSPFTFVSFLKAVDRLADFTNRGSMAPLRLEFVAYLRWVTAQLTHLVRYGTRALRVRPVVVAGQVVRHDVTLRHPDGREETLRVRDVVVAGGLSPHLPDGVVEGLRTWHSARHLTRVADVAAPAQVVVVGAGQSAAEVTMDLYRRFPDAQVHLVSSRFGLVTTENGPLANQVFDPATVDVLFDAAPEARERVLTTHAHTNYGGASTELVREVFEARYRDRWQGVERLVLHRCSRVTGVTEAVEDVVVEVHDELAGERRTLRADAVVLATGYRPHDPAGLLGPDAGLLVRDARGRVLVDRDHRARRRATGPAGLYLVGASEHQHGLTASLLSVVAVRAGEIADSLLSAHLAAAHARRPAGPSADVRTGDLADHLEETRV